MLIGEKLTKKQRIFAAVKRMPTDKIPKGDILIHNRLAKELVQLKQDNRALVTNEDESRNKEELCAEFPGRNEIDVDIQARNILKHDLASFWNDGLYKIVKKEKSGIYVKNHWGMNLLVDNNGEHYLEPADLETRNDLLNYSMPSLENYNVEGIVEYKEKSDLFTFAIVNGVFHLAYLIIGFEKYMLWSIEHLQVIESFTKRLAKFHVEVAKRFIDAGADGIIISDDLCHNTAPFMSCSFLQQVIFPSYREMIRSIKEYCDIPIALHCDGNINPIIGNIVECGFDCLQALQSSAGVDIGKIKKEYGDRICLWGNIDIEECLAHGNEALIRKTVRDTIDAAGSESGYIFSSSNMLSNAVPPLNALIMYDEAEKYGVNEDLC